jgi:hypothetical protein
MSDLFKAPIGDPGDCPNCGQPMNVHQTTDGEETIWCSACDRVDLSELSDAEEYRCHGCDRVLPNCVAHHVSYDPEVVVPLCSNCHARLHADEDYLPELTPDLSRGEAEARDLVTVFGLDDSWAAGTE